MRLFHIVDPRVWAEAVGTGQYRPASLRSEGFVHFSFAEQVQGSANLHYADADELVVVEVDPERLGAEVVVEDTTGRGTAFPHVYAAVPTSAAVAVHPLTRGADGAWTFSASGAGGRA